MLKKFWVLFYRFSDIIVSQNSEFINIMYTYEYKLFGILILTQ